MLGNLYRLKFMVDKLFLLKKFLLKMGEGGLVTKILKHWTLLIVLSMDIKITEKENWINVLCSFSYSQDTLVMAIGINNTTLKIDDMTAYLFSKEIRCENMEG